MKKVYSSEHGFMTGHIKEILEEEGIDCMIKNLNLTGAVGEIPPIECWPEIWILHDEDYNQAHSIIEGLTKESNEYRSSWVCHCGEKIEGQFTACWSCGTARG